MTVRRLRTLRDGGGFEAELEGLPEPAKSHVYEVLRRLRVEAQLPGLDDVDEILPPCKPVGWRRSVPGTDLWVYYDIGDVFVTLRSVRIPRTLSSHAAAALEDELSRPPPTPYIRLVPDDPDAPPDA